MSCKAASLKAHPYAEIVPPLEGEPFDELVADIRANGLLHPITIHQGMVLDGRNRLRACQAARIEPRFVEYDGGDPLSFVLSQNLHRRHLSESQRGMVVARLETLKHGGDRKEIKMQICILIGRRSRRGSTYRRAQQRAR